MASREKCRDSFVIPSDSVCDYDDYFYDGQYDDCPDYYDYDDPDDYDSFPSVYGFVGPDDYELYYDLYGSDGCGIYCVALGIVENRWPDVSHWSDNVRHDIQKGDVILSRTGQICRLLCLKIVLWVRLVREAVKTPQEMVVDLECQDTVRGTLEWDRMYMVDPRSVSGLSCDPVRFVSDKIVHG